VDAVASTISVCPRHLLGAGAKNRGDPVGGRHDSGDTELRRQIQVGNVRRFAAEHAKEFGHVRILQHVGGAGRQSAHHRAEPHEQDGPDDGTGTVESDGKSQ
jgi:hypothetical protein